MEMERTSMSPLTKNLLPRERGRAKLDMRMPMMSHAIRLDMASSAYKGLALRAKMDAMSHFAQFAIKALSRASWLMLHAGLFVGAERGCQGCAACVRQAACGTLARQSGHTT